MNVCYIHIYSVHLSCIAALPACSTFVFSIVVVVIVRSDTSGPKLPPLVLTLKKYFNQRQWRFNVFVAFGFRFVCLSELVCLAQVWSWRGHWITSFIWVTCFAPSTTALREQNWHFCNVRQQAANWSRLLCAVSLRIRRVFSWVSGAPRALTATGESNALRTPWSLALASFRHEWRRCQEQVCEDMKAWRYCVVEEHNNSDHTNEPTQTSCISFLADAVLIQGLFCCHSLTAAQIAAEALSGLTLIM